MKLLVVLMVSFLLLVGCSSSGSTEGTNLKFTTISNHVWTCDIIIYPHNQHFDIIECRAR
jgi:uncharacterized protein YcfL